MARDAGMIEPFEAQQVREHEDGRVISYGTSSYGYDIRCAGDFKIFTNINSAIVDPKNFDANSFVDVKSDAYGANIRTSRMILLKRNITDKLFMQ